MSWDTVIEQQRVVESIRRTLARERVAHAYLFHGKEGVGKRAVALAFARTLQCPTGGDAACGACLTCRKAARMVHPDIHFLFPYPNDAAIDDIVARAGLLAENPYETIDFVRRPSLDDPTRASNKQAFYSVSRINEEVRRAMSFKPVEGRYKVVVLSDAHLFRTEAANAFLKLLEEPTPQTVFILTTDRVDQLLPTIASRCQKIRFDPLSPGAIEQALVERGITPAAEAAAIARMADGSFSRAMALAQSEDLQDSRRHVVEFMRKAYSQDIDALADQVEQMARMGREQLKGVLDLMLGWIRDLMLYRVLGREAPLVNVDQAGIIARFCQGVPDADLDAMAGLVEETIGLVERNVHLTLTLIVLAQSLGKAMRGPHPGKLYVPLVEPALAAAL